MARPLRIAYPGAYYHVTSRGNEQKDVFKSRRDREKFLEYLASATERYGAAIHAYCLMSNHYHLLLETPEGNLSQIMRHINGAYTTYFNIKRKRAGHLFQGRFKAILVEADEYAVELSRYIHLNPVRAGMVESPGEYLWSSFQSYIGQSKVPDWLKTDFILGYFGKSKLDAAKKYGVFVEELIGKEYDSPLQGVIGAAVLGSPGFVESVMETNVGKRELSRDLPALRQLTIRPTLEAIITAVDTVFHSDKKMARQAGMYLCHRYSGKLLREVSNLFKVSESAITEAARTFPLKIKTNKKLVEEIKRVKSTLNICDL
ncbi:MAG: transposase [Desulfuromonadaceae bacterium]|nr:transposase [Desulfuromonadaceae bacterium]MDD2848916.1 transposase [Desulfuromonadaceae bacterium]MDD4132127.1 transposase [Desulfuromonadaceae bacterium]